MATFISFVVVDVVIVGTVEGVDRFVGVSVVGEAVFDVEFVVEVV